MKLIEIDSDDVINTEQICRIKQVDTHIAVMLADGTKLIVRDISFADFIKSLNSGKLKK